MWGLIVFRNDFFPYNVLKLVSRPIESGRLPVNWLYWACLLHRSESKSWCTGKVYEQSLEIDQQAQCLGKGANQSIIIHIPIRHTSVNHIAPHLPRYEPSTSAQQIWPISSGIVPINSQSDKYLLAMRSSTTTLRTLTDQKDQEEQILGAVPWCWSSNWMATRSRLRHRNAGLKFRLIWGEYFIGITVSLSCRCGSHVACSGVRGWISTNS